MKREILYVGTFTDKGAEGIYSYRFDRDNMTFSALDTIRGLVSPSFLTISHNKKYLYSANRGGTTAHPNWGSVSAFKINDSGTLVPINTMTSYGVSPCHISIDKTDKHVFLSHYVSGSLTSISVDESGALQSLKDSIQHFGHSILAERQEGPHIHSSLISDDNETLVVADLGTDKMYSYRVDEVTGKLKLADSISLEPGSGPRHFTFHPSAMVLYVVEELSSTISSYQYHSSSGKLSFLNRSSTLPPNYEGTNTAADIQITPNGRYLYVSNRGHDSIALFKLSLNGETPERIGIESSLGKQPRNLMIDQQGEFLFAANRYSNNIAVFRISQQTGQLHDTGIQIEVPTPVCLKLISL